MKVLVVSTLLAVLRAASAGSVAWPGARVLSVQPTAFAAQPAVIKTVLPHTKVFGFSTTQYINSIPSAVPLALQPQVHYSAPHLAHFAPVQQFFPIAGPPYYPSNIFYPPIAISPVAPGYPAPIAPAPGQPTFPQENPSYPPQNTEPAGDADTAVVDSADIPQEQNPATEAPQQDKPSSPQIPSVGNYPFPSAPQGDAPVFPSLPQFPQGSIPQFPQGESPSFPSLPQFPQGDGQPAFPSFPQFPPGSLPQFPQGSLPQFPQFPQFPSNPNVPQSPAPAPPSSFPGDAGGDKGLNDEDTISVESA